MIRFLTALWLSAALWLSPACGAEPERNDIKSALEKAKAAAQKQKKAISENNKAIEELLEAKGKLAAQKRIEWEGVGMLRAGFSEEQVGRTLTRGGTVVAWGGNSEGQTTVPAGLSGVVAIAAGNFYTVALKQDGTVVAWGSNKDDARKIETGQTTVPAGLSGVVAIAAGGAYTVALKQDGTVVA